MNRTMHQRPKNQLGIGLIEVMVTLVVISIGILALVNFQSFAFRSAAVASDRAAAISIAQDNLAYMRSYSSLNKGSMVNWLLTRLPKQSSQLTRLLP